MEFEDITDHIKKLRKRDDELAKGWGQIVTPLEIETSGGFKTTENAEDTENYYPSVISVPSVVDYPYSNQKKLRKGKQTCSTPT